MYLKGVSELFWRWRMATAQKLEYVNMDEGFLTPESAESAAKQNLKGRNNEMYKIIQTKIRDRGKNTFTVKR